MSQDRDSSPDANPSEPAGRDGPQIRREALRPPLPKRFYKAACVSDAAEPPFAVLLDGRAVRTPKKRPLALATRRAAALVAAEWDRQGAEIDPATMPATRIVNAALDAVAGAEDAVRADIAAFAMSDLVCYRAEHPGELVRLQSAAWDPVVAWAEAALGHRLVLAAGIMPVVQHPGIAAGVVDLLRPYDAVPLAALHVVTTLTGSALLALALAAGRLTAAEVWAAAHVDEDYQVAQWGEDADAAARRAFRWREMQAAAVLIAAGGDVKVG